MEVTPSLHFILQTLELFFLRSTGGEMFPPDSLTWVMKFGVANYIAAGDYKIKGATRATLGRKRYTICRRHGRRVGEVGNAKGPQLPCN